MSKQNSRISIKDITASLLIISIVLGILFFPLIKGKVLLPLDILNNFYYPYCGEETANKQTCFNHYVNDSIRFYYPYKIFLKKLIQDKQLPFWNPLILGGYPFYAHSTTAIFDIFNVFLFFFDTIIAVEIAVVLQMLLAGFSMYLLLKHYGISFFGAMLGSIGYMLNGMFIVSIYHEWILGAFCWVPLIFLMMLKWLDTNKIRYYSLTTLFMGIAYLGGSIQINSYLVFLFSVYILYERFILQNLTNKKFIQGLFLPFMAMLCTAFMWVPTLYSIFMDASGRVCGGAREMHSLTHIIFALPVLAVNLFDNALIGSVRAFEIIKLWGPGMDEFNISCGFAVAFFAVWAFWKGRSNSTIRFFFLLGLTAYVLPLLTPLYKFTYYRIMIVCIFSLCVSAGFGFDFFLNGNFQETKKRYIRLFLVLLLIIVLIIVILQIFVKLNDNYFRNLLRSYILPKAINKFFGSSPNFYIGRIENLLHYYNLANPLISISTVLILGTLVTSVYAIKKKITKNLSGITICALLSLELIMYAKAYIVMCDTDKYPMYKDLAIIDELRKDTDIYRVLVDYRQDELPLFYYNVLMAYDIETVEGDDSYYPHNIKLLALNHFPHLEYEDLVNAKYIISRQNIENDKFELIYDDSEVKLYRNENFMPRVFCLYSYLVREGAENQLKLMRDPKFNYRECAVVSKEMPFKSAFCADKYNSFSSVNIEEYHLNNIKISLETSKDCLMVISNTFFPGWQAKVNGLNREIQRVNYCMQGIYIPKGKHNIEFSFVPKIFYISLFFSIITLLCLIANCFSKKNNL